MRIRARLIGRYKTIVGKEYIELEVKDTPLLRDVLDAFVSHYPTVEKDRRFMMVCKNSTFTSPDTPLKEGDEVAICPPVVSGG
ncbi:MAG TPA: MoaD/ThiS family protein [Candidatus Thermoplasmatota archaeon]|nr:MoaD/ThiS family protein [Candidatus Thermoplasmatota archaeon]